MARKQKGSTAKPQSSSNGRARSKGGSSLERWNTIDDIPETEQDSFHRQQDKTSLGDTSTGKGSVDQDDEYGALSYGRSVLDVADEELESDGEDDGEDFDEDDESEGEESEAEQSARHQRGKASAAAPRKAAFGDDDIDDDEDEDDDEDGEDADEDRDARVGGWGPNKQSYYSTNNLDDLSSDSEMDEEERREMEIREVKRLQTKSRQGVIDEDFGLGQDTLKLEGSSQAREARRKEFEGAAAVSAKAPASSSPLDMKRVGPVQRADLMLKMQKASPETLALIGEYADIVEDIEVVSSRMRRFVSAGGEPQMTGLCCLHHQLLLTYAANLSFYFYLRASPKYAQDPSKLATHAVIGRLWKLKNGLQMLDNFGFNADEEEDEDEDDSLDGEKEGFIDEDEENRDPRTSFLFKPSGLGGDDDDDEDSVSLGSLEEDELMQLDQEDRESGEAKKRAAKPASKEAAAAKPEKQGKQKTKKKQTISKAPKDVAPLANVAEGIDAEDDSFGSMKQRKKSNAKRVRMSTDAEAYSAFGEPTELNASDSADKEAKKRSLRFYTGQIDAKDARKAGGSGLGGDTDIPYRDRERSRMAVANANAKKDASLGGSAGDRRLDGDEWGEDDSRDWRDVMDVEDGNKKGKSTRDENGDEDDDGNDYYDLVASGKRSNKKAKKEEYDEMRAAQRVAPMEEMEDGEHRGISRKIEKNRGLTPYRPKENRNPRVKKRKRYEAAQKKLSSRGPVYKGGQGALQGGYEGEKSGINSNVVKSRSFA